MAKITISAEMISPFNAPARTTPVPVFPVAVGPARAIRRGSSDTTLTPEAAVDLLQGNLEHDRPPVRTDEGTRKTPEAR